MDFSANFRDAILNVRGNVGCAGAQAAEAVCAGGVLTADEVLGRLEVLVDNSLVRLVDDSGSNRALEIQETIRE